LTAHVHATAISTAAGAYCLENNGRCPLAGYTCSMLCLFVAHGYACLLTMLFKQCSFMHATQCNTGSRVDCTKVTVQGLPVKSCELQGCMLFANKLRPTDCCLSLTDPDDLPSFAEERTFGNYRTRINDPRVLMFLALR